MNTNNIIKRCRICKKYFVLNPKVEKRQYACSRYECQRIRQKINHISWLKRNPVNYNQWYQDYGKNYRKKHPNYQRLYRQEKRKALSNCSRQSTSYSQLLKPLISAYQAEKKEELTSVKLNRNAMQTDEKIEPLTNCFILLKAKELSFLPLSIEKKKELTYCFHDI